MTYIKHGKRCGWQCNSDFFMDNFKALHLNISFLLHFEDDNSRMILLNGIDYENKTQNDDRGHEQL